MYSRHVTMLRCTSFMSRRAAVLQHPVIALRKRTYSALSTLVVTVHFGWHEQASRSKDDFSVVRRDSGLPLSAATDRFEMTCRKKIDPLATSVASSTLNSIPQSTSKSQCAASACDLVLDYCTMRFRHCACAGRKKDPEKSWTNFENDLQPQRLRLSSRNPHICMMAHCHRYPSKFFAA
jgi:hypothetical protein